MGEKILITGGSGLIGTRLTELLLESKYEVVHLGRKQVRGRVRTFLWDPGAGEIDGAALEGVSAVIHLAGASIGGRRWTSAYKEEILDSRVKSTKLLFESIQARTGSVRAFISASAIGYYGTAPRHSSLVEEDKAGDDFPATVVRRWESEVAKLGTLGLRVCMIRTGIVLSADGSALTKMARPIRFGIGAPLGSGEQIVSWVHIDDVCRAYIFLLENQLSGPFNITAPVPVSNSELTKAIAHQLGKPLWLPNIPGFVLKVVLGEMAEAVLTGNAVSAEKIMNRGFRFEFVDVRTALRNLL